ncbi:fumarate reductase/succinate dehydrogenase flavoprotein subunit, partial [Plantactinospora endophytica]
ELEKAGRVADYLELAELMCIDALTRKESCGAHFREEYQTKDGEALRKDEEFSFSSVWKFTGNISKPDLYKEALIFKKVKPVERNYK